ncbi:AraC family transcriptional regulator [Paenibacillus alba]|uniref:Helix-turn-helix transcriptional regulator n=1 Tax=Paenibacillus alba TaxID=1197127 RepID=A0ABU6G5X2_9BACL|nr:helix-turn-helix transcriptional regulator [Paenibacillus alba]MEC0229566.1 helix-turn-helix transcriptional regulator [Paenibacillus alba]NQX71830.1 helix-turn-helix transcriptional regulator [Paenibacillus alba]
MTVEGVDKSDWLEGPSLIAFWGNDDSDNPFRLGTREYDWHSHRRGQIFCVESGLIHVRTATGSWLMPPRRAGWLPPNVAHKVSISGAMSGWSVLLTPEISSDLSKQPCVINVSDLMRALVQRTVSWGDQDILEPEQERLVAVLLDEIRRAPLEPLHLPMPSDPRLLRIADMILKQPEDNRTLNEWATWAALSPRTLRRLILAETGLTFNLWRQQARLTHALEMLAQGESVGMVADALGYGTPSSFIAMFRRAFGDSPLHYLAVRREQKRSPYNSPY